MATIKSYTDLSQSKVLAEILPLDSADMCYLPTHIGDEYHFIASLSPYSVCTKMTDVSIEYCTPCWSLAALLDVLPKTINFGYENDSTFVLEPLENGKYLADYYKFSFVKDNPVDACVAMIEHLHGLKIL